MGAELGSIILDNGKSPAEWCEIFAGRGIAISERSLRQKARELGACHVLGNAMIITPEQIDRILENRTCRSKPTPVALLGGPRVGSNITGDPSPATSAKALEHMKKLARKTGSRNGPKRNNVVSFSERKSAR